MAATDLLHPGRGLFPFNPAPPEARLSRDQRERLPAHKFAGLNSPCPAAARWPASATAPAELQLHLLEQQPRRDHGGRRHISSLAQKRQRSAVIDEFEHSRLLRRRQNIAQRARGDAAEPQAAHQLLAPIRIDPVDQNRRADRPRRAAGLLAGLRQRLQVARRSPHTDSSACAPASHTACPAPASSESASSSGPPAAWTGWSSRTDCRWPPGWLRSCRSSRAWPLEAANPFTGCRVIRKLLRIPFSITATGLGGTPSRSN